MGTQSPEIHRTYHQNLTLLFQKYIKEPSSSHFSLKKLIKTIQKEKHFKSYEPPMEEFEAAIVKLN